MKNTFDTNWTNFNNGFQRNDSEVQRYISVVPSERQLRHSKKPYYCFIHFGMNTATAREWGTGKETVNDFTIKSVDTAQWVRVIKSSGATGIIFTCKHHDGFCLWESEYTDFSVKNSAFNGDIVKMLSDECRKQGMNFGVYLSPWDMHDKRYGTPEYNDYFCNQLTELLTKYGEIFEVWFDGAKGANAVDFDYDWNRYFDLVRSLQPNANMAICGPDIRWIGNEGGKTRKAEYSVVPSSLREAEKVIKESQHGEDEADKLKNKSTDRDLGSRSVLSKAPSLCWYQAEVDVSIRKGWFYSKNENCTVKSAKKLFNIYLNSVGNNCTLLLNIPPTENGIIHHKDEKVLKKFGAMIDAVTEHLIAEKDIGELSDDCGYIDFDFGAVKKLRYITLSEDTRFSQRVESFDIYIRKKNGKYRRVYDGTVIGAKKIVAVKGKKCIGARIVIRQSRSNPVIEKIGFYE